MSADNWPVFPLGPEDDLRTEYKDLAEMTLADLELAVAYCSDESEREKLEELLRNYRHLLQAGFVLDDVVENFGSFSWCKPTRFHSRLYPRSRRPR